MIFNEEGDSIHMQALFDAINAVCSKIQVISDLFWDFPANFLWYSSIPILGNFSLAIILLLGSGIFFTCKLRFIQVRYFRHGMQVLKTRKAATAMQTNVIRQLRYRPMIRPNGSPAIMAMDVPVTIMPSAVVILPFGAIRTASGEAIDQNMAWVQATPILDAIRT